MPDNEHCYFLQVGSTFNDFKVVHEVIFTAAKSMLVATESSSGTKTTNSDGTITYTSSCEINKKDGKKNCNYLIHSKNPVSWAVTKKEASIA